MLLINFGRIELDSIRMQCCPGDRTELIFVASWILIDFPQRTLIGIGSLQQRYVWLEQANFSSSEVIWPCLNNNVR